MKISVRSVIFFSTFSTITTSIAVPEILQLPYSLPDDAKYYPGKASELARRNANNDNDNRPRVPPVMKMSGLEDEKYFFPIPALTSDNSDFTVIGNETLQNHRPPIRVHFTDKVLEKHEKRERWNGWVGMGMKLGLVKRQAYTCPAGSTSCMNISRPLSCCDSSTVCQVIPNIGFGDVGCCPQGQTCSGNLASCAQGYIKCSSDKGAGCCRPDYKCGDTGCIPALPVTSYLTTMPTVATGLDICERSYYPCPSSLSYGCCRIGRLCGVSDCPLNTGFGTPGIEYLTFVPNAMPMTSVVPITPVLVSAPAVATPMVTQLITQILTTTTTIQTIINTVNTIVVSSSITYTTIEPQMTSVLTIVSTITVTSISTALSVTTDVSPTTITADDGVKLTNAAGGLVTADGSVCPTGLYLCPSSLNGGCCRSGRLCGESNCPASSVTVTQTITTASAITTEPAIGQGTCGAGWYQCPASLNGGCCPSGYICAFTNCPASTLLGTNGQLQTQGIAASKTGDAGKVLISGWKYISIVLYVVGLSVYLMI